MDSSEVTTGNCKPFDQLLDNYNNILFFEREYSFTVLNNFHDAGNKKFDLTISKDNNLRLNLSSTTVCTYALSQYEEAWKQEHKDGYVFHDLEQYHKNILRRLDACIKAMESGGSEKDEHLIDEFTILNTLFLLTKINRAIDTKHSNLSLAGVSPEPGNDRNTIPTEYKKILKLINGLCCQYLFNSTYPLEENQHPFIFYRFLCILEYWCKQKCWYSSEKLFDLAFNQYYNIAKREMYRQMALHAANDRTLFDVKRLIYSYLIVTMQNSYTNTKIKKEVLDIIFKEQHGTGLWPICQVVKPVFNIEMISYDIKVSLDKTPPPMRVRTVSSSPLLSSFECLNDMLEHTYLKEDLEKYENDLRVTYDWVTIRLMKDEVRGNVQGWIPEYDGSHTPKSWMAGHCLIFLKRYEELISNLIKKRANKDLHVTPYNNLQNAKKWSDLRDSYGYKTYLENLFHDCGESSLSDPDYRSVLLYGPAGAGKSAIAKAIAARLCWSYVEIPPGYFLDKGNEKIIEKINYVFKRLKVLKNTVIFLDEIDQLVEDRQHSQVSGWIITSFIPAILELQKNPNIKLVLATNDITRVDSSLIRRGKIDFILPIGSVCWKDRLRLLIHAMKSGDDDKGQFPAEFQVLGTLDHMLYTEFQKNIPPVIEATPYLKNYLMRTNFVVGSEIHHDILKIFKQNSDQWRASELYKTFFSGETSNYETFENPRYKQFHNWTYLDFMSVPASIPHSDISPLKVLNENIYMTPLFQGTEIDDDDVHQIIVNLNTAASSKDQLNYRYILDRFSDDMKDLLKTNNVSYLDYAKFKEVILCEFNLLLMGSSLESRIRIKGTPSTARKSKKPQSPDKQHQLNHTLLTAALKNNLG